MKFHIFFIFGLTFLWSCQSDPTEQQETQTIEMEEVSPLSLEVLAQNDRIQIGPIQRKTVAQHISCTGRLEVPPTHQIAVHSKIDGQVKNLKYLPGDYVKKGALLAHVENPALITKQQQWLENQAHLSFAQKDFERKKTLKAGDATTQRAFEISQQQVELLQATQTGLQQELQILGIDVTQIKSDQALQWRIPIYAPQAGIVQEVFVHEGQAIHPEQPILQLVNPNHLHLELQVLAQDIGGLEKGQTVRFSLAGQTTEHLAEIVKINPMVHPETNTLQVHCHIKMKDKTDFVSGIFVNAIIEKGSQEVAGLPLQAVIKEGENYFAYHIKDEQVEKTLLKNARMNDSFVVFDGNIQGEWVTEGAYYVE